MLTGTACPPPPGVDVVEPIVIGVPIPMAYSYGYSAHKGAILAAEEINAKGGVLGRPLKLEFVDTRDLEPGVPVIEGVLAVEKLILERGAVALVGGPARSEVAVAAMDIVAKYRIPQILSTGAGSPVISDRIAGDDKYRYTFRMTMCARDEIPNYVAILELLQEMHGFDKVYMMAQDVAHARATVAALEARLPGLNWTIVGRDLYPTGATDFAPGLMKVKGSGAQVLYLAFDMPQVSILMQQWYDMKVPALPFGFIGPLEEPGMWVPTGGRIEYGITQTEVAGAIPVPGIPWSEQFFEAHTKRWGIEPEAFGAQITYMAVYVMADAIERAGSVDADAIQAALLETDMMGISGRVRFHPDTHLAIVDRESSEKGVLPTFVQWQVVEPGMPGKRVAIWPPAAVEPGDEIKLPPWMLG
jgi:branched-chain amino acid transport system substrate-binding protein